MKFIKYPKLKLYLIVVLLCVSLNVTNVHAISESNIYVGVWAVDDYPALCKYSDLSRVVDLRKEIVDNINSNTERVVSNKSASRSDLISKVNNYDLSFYLGHGLKDPYRLHLTADHPTLSCSDTKNNIKRSDLNLGGQIEFMHFHTCNFLRALNWDERTEIMNMMDGVHMMLGYGTTMWMYPGQMKSYMTKLKAGNQVKDAWVDAARIYQPKAQTSLNVQAVVVAHGSTIYNTLNSVDTTDPVKYSSSNASEYYLYSYGCVVY